MKRSRSLHLFLSVLFILVSLSACKSVPPLEANKTGAMTGGGITKTIVQALAKLAVKYGDDALNAQKLALQARGLNNLDELLVQQKRAVEASRLAQTNAAKAVALQQKLDDLARVQVADDVLRAQQAADDAKAIAGSMARLRLFAYQMKVKEITTRVIDNVPNEFQEAAKEVVTEVFCDVLGKRLAGPMPSRELVKFSVHIRLITVVPDPDALSATITDSIRAEADYLAKSLQWQDEVDGYKGACGAILDLP